jgi:hypothetical protein
MRHSVRIAVDGFQAFSSRTDSLVRLRFRYDAQLVGRLKETLREARRLAGGPAGRPAGGWLAEHRCWFVEPCVWPWVRQKLVEAGCVLEGPAAGDGDPPVSGPSSPGPRPPVDWVNLVRQWYRQLCLDFTLIEVGVTRR